ncbi:hypothetical protein GK2840 [Geobacillus kaustophilus HTA426]|uniref:Uncharacterized protein n=1 Tax=Geobacillus kaustophilus (strain HTA426) TaxID=235909 RepID=Q5KW11_GEOKA|nr:hypothetical protein GK2840 [Geobacillus kaustophilus HTA426]
MLAPAFSCVRRLARLRSAYSGESGGSTFLNGEYCSSRTVQWLFAAGLA